MGDDGSISSKKRKNSTHENFLDSLKSEWNLFWHSIVGDTEEETTSETELDLFSNKLDNMSVDQIRAMIKSLSQDRKLINQRIEVLHKEIELNQAKIDSYRVLGQDFSNEEKRLSELHDLGQGLTHQLSKTDSFLKLARAKDSQIKKEIKAQQMA